MSGTVNPFFNTALPNQLSFLTAAAGYDGSSSAYTSGGWDYQAALTPQLLSSALADNEANQTATLGAIADLGNAQFSQINADYAGWANNENTVAQSFTQSLSTIANKSGSGGSGIFGQIMGGLGSLGAIFGL